jgi:hypothetical protein
LLFGRAGACCSASAGAGDFLAFIYLNETASKYIRSFRSPVVPCRSKELLSGSLPWLIFHFFIAPAMFPIFIIENVRHLSALGAIPFNQFVQIGGVESARTFWDSKSSASSHWIRFRLR